MTPTPVWDSVHPLWHPYLCEIEFTHCDTHTCVRSSAPAVTPTPVWDPVHPLWHPHLCEIQTTWFDPQTCIRPSPLIKCWYPHMHQTQSTWLNVDIHTCIRPSPPGLIPTIAQDPVNLIWHQHLYRIHSARCDTHASRANVSCQDLYALQEANCRPLNSHRPLHWNYGLFGRHDNSAALMEPASRLEFEYKNRLVSFMARASGCYVVKKGNGELGPFRLEPRLTKKRKEEKRKRKKEQNNNSNKQANKQTNKQRRRRRKVMTTGVIMAAFDH